MCLLGAEVRRQWDGPASFVKPSLPRVRWTARHAKNCMLSEEPAEIESVSVPRTPLPSLPAPHEFPTVNTQSGSNETGWEGERERPKRRRWGVESRLAKKRKVEIPDKRSGTRHTARGGNVTRSESETFLYQIDGQDRIVQVSPNWDDFALRNDAPDVCARRILNCPLMVFLSGLEMKHLYQTMLAKVRTTKNPLTVPFRCDGPTVRRFMELTMRPLDGNRIEFQTIVLREESRDPVGLLDRTFQRSDQQISMCAWCKKVRVGSEWLEVEDAIGKLQLFQEPLLPSVTHGLCSPCLAQLKHELDEVRP